MAPGKMVRWLARCCFGLLFVSFAAGCSSIKVEHQDRGLNSRDLVEGKLGIAAVGGLGGGEYFLSENVSQALTESLAAIRPEIPVVPLAEIKPLLPEAEYQAFLREFSEVPSVRAEDWALLDRASPKARYLLLVQISDDEIRQSESQSAETSESYVKNSKTGKWETETTTDSYIKTRSKTRSIGMRFFICDLKTRRPVWVAVGSDASESGSQLRSFTPFGSSPSWPSAPSTMEPIKDLVKQAVQKLPR